MYKCSAEIRSADVILRYGGGKREDEEAIGNDQGQIVK